ncbi:2-keto-4-pentenoate hydratase [Micromonospora sp. NBC_01412]|uniref:2-keto-4-pentenoate hydratase n=1 Tax=Micromonospora sp. NBC_01412 TaxID=2903590 RepID=UPI003251CF54
MSVDIEAANRELAEARSSGKPCPPLRGRLLPEGDVESAYRVQQLQTRAWQGRGERRVGAKIGLTSRAAQESLGVHQPDFGLLTDAMAVGDGVEVPFGRLLQPKVEAEIAFVLGRDLTDERVTVVDLIRAVDHVLPAIEIVDSRIAGWDISIVDTVADNASSGMFVLGTTPRRLADVDLRLCGMVLEHAGEPVSVGAGAASMGNPLNALEWLVGTLVRAGDPLRAGDLVLSGSLGPVVPATPGAAYEARISGLGSVRTSFGREPS